MELYCFAAETNLYFCFLYFHSLFFFIFSHFSSVAHHPAHVKDERREVVHVHDTNVSAEFTDTADIVWRALGRGVLHCSDPGPWTQRHAFFLLHSIKRKQKTDCLCIFVLFLCLCLFLQKENQERKDKKERRGDLEELALLERLVSFLHL